MLRGLLDRFKGGSEVPQVDTRFMSESGIIDLFLFMGPTARDVFRQYSALTGVTPLPPVCLLSLSPFSSLFLLEGEREKEL